MSKSETDFAAAKRKLREARAALNAYTLPDGEEDETYIKLNNAVLEAEKDVPWIFR